MPTPLRYIPRPEERAPTPVLDLPRPQLAARIATLRQALTDLRELEPLDGALPLDCIGSMKRCLIAMESELFRRDHPQEPAPPTPEPAMPLPVALAAVSQNVGPYAPTEKQVAYYRRLTASPVFSEEERGRVLDWLATRATRQTIKDQIDALKRIVETRQPAGAR